MYRPQGPPRVLQPCILPRQLSPGSVSLSRGQVPNGSISLYRRELRCRIRLIGLGCGEYSERNKVSSKELLCDHHPTPLLCVDAGSSPSTEYRFRIQRT